MLTNRLVTVALFLLGTLATQVVAQDAADEKWRTAHLSADAAGPDFEVQGEYEGSIAVGDTAAGDSTQKIGVQVIALGDGRFRAVVLQGGLPGDGWTGKPRDREVMTGQTKGDVTSFRGAGKTATIKDELLTFYADDEELGQLKKVIRESETLGMEPPKGAIVLFDGSSTDNFEGGQLSDDGSLMHGTTSKEKFGDCQLHLEFQLSYMPFADGQRRSNSGVYLQGRYECQVLDSFGLEGVDNECGGIYGIAAPKVNMCFPPLSWQTYDIDFTAAKFDETGKLQDDARMTVRHNGVTIHHNIKLPRSTAAATWKLGPEPGPLYLQDHTNPVRYRNIWMVKR